MQILLVLFLFGLVTFPVLVYARLKEKPWRAKADALWLLGLWGFILTWIIFGYLRLTGRR